MTIGGRQAIAGRGMAEMVRLGGTAPIQVVCLFAVGFQARCRWNAPLLGIDTFMPRMKYVNGGGKVGRVGGGLLSIGD